MLKILKFVLYSMLSLGQTFDNFQLSESILASFWQNANKVDMHPSGLVYGQNSPVLRNLVVDMCDPHKIDKFYPPIC